MTDQEKLDIDYAEYLRVTDAIQETAMELNYCSEHAQHKEIVPSFQKDLDALLERFPHVLGQLEKHGVNPATLILKSLGVKTNLLAGTPAKTETEETQP